VPEALLSIESADVDYGEKGTRVRALSDVSLTFKPGELTLIMGPSGSGKTTLLAVLGCLLTPDRGRVVINGSDATGLSERQRTTLRRGNIGFVFQAFRLFHSLSALENVMLAAEIAGSRDEKRRKAATELLEQFGLADKLHLKPKALSGGEKQRVAIARALVTGRPILLADEPTASLDSAAGRQICEILRRLSDERRHIVVVVSHDPRWVEFAHRTVVLEDGRVIDSRRNKE
jgi:putative ABC transport system ATP-binding protein